ncbi:unnamed protein product, partial [marine sediment metagenome]
YLEASKVFKGHEDRMGYAQARENVALLRVGLTGADPTEELKLALETYRAIGNRDHELKTLYNLYCFYTSTRNPSAGDTLRDIMSLVSEHRNLDQETRARVLFGILPVELPDRNDLMVLRERLLDLKTFYKGRHEQANVARCLRQLARVEQVLRNTPSVRSYALELKRHVGQLPRAERMTVHSDLGFWLFRPEDPEEGLGHFWEAYDLAEGLPPPQQRSVLIVLTVVLPQAGDSLDRALHRGKARRALESAADPATRALLR